MSDDFDLEPLEFTQVTADGEFIVERPPPAAHEATLFGTDLFGEAAVPTPQGALYARFVIPPSTILDGRSGAWRERKKAWLSLGIQSETGREGVEVYQMSNWLKTKAREKMDHLDVSVFDPVLTECCYRWWSGADSQIVDPFAGGSVRGIVAGVLGRKYWGVDLRDIQVAANEAQADVIETAVRPEWVVGDALDQMPNAPEADFLFSCPPYGDLEVYSDDPADLSNMTWEEFLEAYREIIRLSVERLADNRFAAFVVGDFRDKDGHYRNFVSETIRAFEDAGMHFYNEATILTPIGGAMYRMNRIFNGSRKLTRVHQNLVGFVKGSWREAVKHCEDGIR